MGLVCAGAAALLMGLDQAGGLVLAGVVLLVSGFLDIIDGAAARAAGAESRRGAFLDSVSDKVGEVIVFAGILLGSLAPPYLVLFAISLSLLVSYTRSRAESLGVRLQGVGIGERAERLLVIAVALIIGGAIQATYVIEYAVVAVCVIAGVTLIQRVIVASRSLCS